MIKSVLVSHVTLSRRAIFPRGPTKCSPGPRLFQEFHRLRDYADDGTEGVFYAEEVHKVHKTDDIYKIEKILAEKKENGKVKVLVRWLGHDKKSYKYPFPK